MLEMIKKCARRATRAANREDSAGDEHPSANGSPADDQEIPAAAIPDCDQQKISEYFGYRSTRKLHIGCGQNIIDGWLNSDYYPSEHIIHLDAAAAFPFEDSQFNYIFSEHMIEHLPYQDGTKMLQECQRVLKPGGTMRITTPDLSFLLALYEDPESQLHKEYIEWATDMFIEAAPGYENVFVINNFVRDWGHQFIYDAKTLREALQRSGFTNITQCQINQSSDTELQNLENEDRMPPGFLQLESMVFEANKPQGE